MYFTKYLPVEETPVKGDTILIPHSWIGTLGDESDEVPGEYYAQNEGSILSSKLANMKKLKLFLCTRDIKMGDGLVSISGEAEATVTKIEEDENLGTKYYIDMSDGPKGLVTTKSDMEDEPANICNWFKKVGEISRDALSYVNEGDEFTEEQVHKYYPGDVDTIEIGKPSFKILGPCGFFH